MYSPVYNWLGLAIDCDGLSMYAYKSLYPLNNNQLVGVRVHLFVHIIQWNLSIIRFHCIIRNISHTVYYIYSTKMTTSKHSTTLYHN